jgi:hypothetical protein
MREYRLVYGSPHRSGRSGESRYVPTCVQVAVCAIPTAAHEAMLGALTDGTAHRARLAGVGGVDVLDRDSGRFGLVLDEALKLPERPAMQSGAHALAGLDPLADVGQIFHPDRAGPGLECYRDDLLAGLVVDVADMPRLAPGDGPQLSPGCAATVGLQATAMGKVAVSVVPQLLAAEHLASALHRRISNRKIAISKGERDRGLLRKPRYPS